MSDLPIEIHEKIIRYAPWDLFCAFVFASKAHHKICKSIDLRKYTRKFDGEKFTVDILPNGIFHGEYFGLLPPAKRCKSTYVKANYAYGRLHGYCYQGKYPDKHITHSKFIRGHLYWGIPLCETTYELYYASPSIKNKAEFKNLPPYGEIMRISTYELYCWQGLNKDFIPISIFEFLKMIYVEMCNSIK